MFSIISDREQPPYYITVASMKAWPIWSSDVQHAKRFDTRREAQSWLRYARQGGTIGQAARIVPAVIHA